MHNDLHDVGMLQQWAYLQRAELLLRNGVSHEQQLLVVETFEQLMAQSGSCRAVRSEAIQLAGAGVPALGEHCKMDIAQKSLLSNRTGCPMHALAHLYECDNGSCSCWSLCKTSRCCSIMEEQH